MPCPREEEEEAGEEAEEEEEEDSFLPLEQSEPLGGSGEVDRLVAQMGEMLKLNAAQDSPATPCVSPGPPLPPPAAVRADGAGPPVLPLLLPPAPAESMGTASPGAVRCALGDRGRVRGRAAPYFVAELAAGHGALSPLPPQSSLDGPSGDDKWSAPKQLSGPCRRGWLREAAAAHRLPHRRRRGPRTDVHGIDDDDPYRLLQQLVLSGNLIKEAVRRLRLRGPRPRENVAQRPFPTPPTATAPESASSSPRAVFSDPGATGGSAPLRTGDGVPVPGN
ncbi:proto-oncogene FRAT1 [Artibeus jamaicensis]|uniref:proto-oncogene FRAT1 n=1 Tax=Artibeus jamaicensis TaxID=9417 RepID=UPI00235ABDC3|nr:proto-oncogene FRAT1 [Artibeus jamaicensis]